MFHDDFFGLFLKRCHLVSSQKKSAEKKPRSLEKAERRLGGIGKWSTKNTPI